MAKEPSSFREMGQKEGVRPSGKARWKKASWIGRIVRPAQAPSSGIGSPGTARAAPSTRDSGVERLRSQKAASMASRSFDIAAAAFRPRALPSLSLLSSLLLLLLVRYPPAPSMLARSIYYLSLSPLSLFVSAILNGGF